MRVFLFHVALFLLLPLVTVVIHFCFSGHASSFDFFLAYGMSAVYSLSFLELWSLTEGSYSLQLLNAIDSGSPERVQELGTAVGLDKQTNRLRGIVRLGLVKQENDRFIISITGWLVAFVTSLIVSASGAKLRE